MSVIVDCVIKLKEINNKIKELIQTLPCITGTLSHVYLLYSTHFTQCINSRIRHLIHKMFIPSQIVVVQN